MSGTLMSRTSFYRPPDQSQIEVLPSDLDGINPCDTELCSRRPSWNSGMRRGSYDEGLDDSSSLYGKGGYGAHLEEMSLRNKSTQFSESDIYTLSRMSTATSRSSLSQRIRYRIVLRLDMRERNLIRDSWAMILNDDSTNNIAAYSKSKHNKGLLKPGINTHSPQRMKRFSTHSSETSSSSDPIVDAKSGVRSNAFTSSLFCSQFYANLLSMEPKLEQMFPSTKHQAVSFAGVLTAAINSLENLQLLEGFLNGLGKRHSRILGIDPPHFELMGVAFLRTLQDRFGVHCTIELEDAWSKLYSYLANSILQFGLDPILHAKLDNDELELPIPNLVDCTPRTIISLKPGNSIDRHSYVGDSMLSIGDDMETGSIDSQFADVPSQKQTDPTHVPMKNHYANGVSGVSLGRSSFTADSPPKKKSPPPKKSVPRKTEAKKAFSKPVATASNKDCIIM